MPVDQAKAQLYLTFAGHGGHKGAQMAMGYRYWSGIGVAEDCMTALTWYEDAAEQGTFTLTDTGTYTRIKTVFYQPWQNSSQDHQVDERSH